jgi:hypothetical protein
VEQLKITSGRRRLVMRVICAAIEASPLRKVSSPRSAASPASSFQRVPIEAQSDLV